IRLGHGRVDDLIARYPRADAVPVAWRMFSHSGHVGLGDQLLLEALTDCEPAEAETGAPGRFVKSLFRNDKPVERMGLHAPVFAEGSTPIWGASWVEADPGADPQRPVRDFGYDIAQVNHYAVRSVEAYLIKRDRGRANHVGETLGIDYWQRWCRGGEADTSIARHVPAVRAELERLRDDPVVDHLHQGAVAWHGKRLAELLEDPAFKQLKLDIMAHEGMSDATEALRIKAPRRHQNRLKMLAEMPKGGRCAEIGVWNGGFSGAILDVTRPKELTLIDPWDLLAGEASDTWTHAKHEDAKAMRAMFDNVCAKYAENPNVVVQKGFSAEVLESFPDAYFDWVYIDGNHLYDFVRKDVELAFRKVRPGGIIAGDDFFWKRDERFHVKEAVLDAMRAQGITNRPRRIGQQFMITVPGG
ncbi:MAG: class I SAM-dependent methyltransferase, partial [Pseudomonadota bacterium]